MSTINRRHFLTTSAAAGLATQLSATAAAQPGTARQPAGSGDAAWLDGDAPSHHEGQSWGLPWPQGAVRKNARFARSDGGAIQSWPLAYWPDGSLKWTAHAIPGGEGPQAGVTIAPGKPQSPQQPVRVRETPENIVIESGDRSWRINRSGTKIISSATVDGREVLRDVRLVALSQDQAELGDKPLQSFSFESAIESAVVEQAGPVRAVVKVSGHHSGHGRQWLPFSLRLYFHAGSDGVRVVHSFVYDGDEAKDFVRGIGLRGSVPMRDPLHDRHVRFAGETDGVFAEAVRTLTGLRRDPGEAYRKAQLAGRKTGPLEGMARNVGRNIGYIPAWGDFTLSQANPDGFTLRKRTKDGHGWIDAIGGHRATGLGYIGGASGGAIFGMEDFWQRAPTRLDVRDAITDAAEVTLWLWSPEAPAMDMRFYHDGLGMDDYAKQRDGLDVTYEDFEPGWGRPYGIARTSTIMLWTVPETPANAHIAELAGNLRRPPRLVATPKRLLAAKVFGDWTLVDRSRPMHARIENQNDYFLRYYMDQVEQRRWYGFWSYGDVMHSADSDRRVWRYDVGGMAWANSELSPDLWLWYSFLRSGRADIFRFAEAMTRHTGEVDQYHLGPLKGLGTRHGVQHWGDSSKQPRVSTAAYRRIYYYLTGDERVGDLMRDLLGSEDTLRRVVIERKTPIAPKPLPAGVIQMAFGTVWSSLAAAWLTEWERSGDKRWRDRLTAGMDTIAAMKNGWFAGFAPFDLTTGRFTPNDNLSVSHLNAVFGAVEVHTELFQLIDHPSYKKAWLDYCVYYNAPKEAVTARFGRNLGGRSLVGPHSRLTAYAAAHLKDPALAKRAWTEYFQDWGAPNAAARNVKLSGPDSFAPVDWNPGIGTNGVAQWGLASFQNLALIGDVVESGDIPIGTRTQVNGVE